MTTKDLADQLTLIEEHAPKLRKAGITRAVIGDVTLELAPDDAPLKLGDDDDEEEPKSPLDDPKAFGRFGKTAKVPGRSKRDQEHGT